MSLPANTSHFSQPLDDICFAQLKYCIKKTASELNFVASITNVDYKENVRCAICEIENTVLRPAVIKKSFSIAGYIPLMVRE